MFSIPSTHDFHHQDPCGSRRESASSNSPAGSARSTADRSGRPSGRNSVVVR